MRHSDLVYNIEDDPLNKPRKSRNWGWGKWALVIAAAVLFVYHSVRPVMRLRADPPSSFFDHYLTWNKEERQQERRVAQAYWQVAVRRIQGRYPPKSQLPTDPPPSFRVSDETRSLKEDIIVGRIHYWHKLREVWRQSDAWNVSYRWNTGWVANSLNSMGQDTPEWVSNAVQTVVGWFNGLVQRIPSP